MSITLAIVLKRLMAKRHGTSSAAIVVFFLDQTIIYEKISGEVIQMTY